MIKAVNQKTKYHESVNQIYQCSINPTITHEGTFFPLSIPYSKVQVPEISILFLINSTYNIAVETKKTVLPAEVEKFVH